MAMLGRIVMNWAFAEHVLEDLISGMLGADVSQINAITANMATEYQIKSARSIARLRFDETGFKQFNTALRHFERLATFRNKLIHGFWAERDEDDQYTVSTIKSGGTLKTQTEYVNLHYLTWMEIQVRALLTLMLGFGHHYGLIEYDKESSPEILSKLTDGYDPTLMVV